MTVLAILVIITNVLLIAFMLTTRVYAIKVDRKEADKNKFNYNQIYTSLIKANDHLLRKLSQGKISYEGKEYVLKRVLINSLDGSISVMLMDDVGFTKDVALEELNITDVINKKERVG